MTQLLRYGVRCSINSYKRFLRERSFVRWEIRSRRRISITKRRLFPSFVHPGNVNTVLKHGWLPRQPGAYFIDMECCEESLTKRIQRGFMNGIRPERSEGDSLRSESEMMVCIWRPGQPTLSKTYLDLDSVVAIALDITEGLTHVHKHNTVHRDLKPQNGISVLSMSSTDS